jgi:hypothetical protein
MEEKDIITNCLLWGIGLYTPVDLGSIFRTEDLQGTGIELDSHITVLYAEKDLPKESMLDDISTILGEEKFADFMEYCKTEKFRDVFTLFELGSFQNDSDYIVLKLKRNNEFFGILNLINKGLRTKYRIKWDFENYTPHITLAELKKGMAQKYLNLPSLHQILNDSKIDFEDVIFSTGSNNNYKQVFLTNYKNIDRYFRIENLKALNKDIQEDSL